MKDTAWLLAPILLVSLVTSRLTGGERRASAQADPRNVQSGFVIRDEGYCDQPYVVITRDGHWLCVLTTGQGREGQAGQHVVSTVSKDQGRTWSKLLDIEPASGPEASWATPLVTSNGRVYVFYDYNGDQIRTLNNKPARADMLGWYCYRYSDDCGASWSAQRYRLPVRVTSCDRRNDWGGTVQIFWGISKPIAVGGSALFAFTKLGKYILDDGEGWFFRSDNILTESDPEKLRWEMLPDGDRGLRHDPFGSVQEEHNILPLSHGDLYCIYRTTTGSPCHSYSRDGGHTWTEPEHATYSPGGKKIKHPRACPKLWQTANGKYLLWFHHNGGTRFEGRNPAWICGGIEKEGMIHWSQPEVLLYDDDPQVRMSYPDLIEQGGRYWITETQKTVARVHPIDGTLLEGLWRQLDPASGPPGRAMQDAVLSLTAEQLRAGEAPMPRLPSLSQRGGFSVELRLRLANLSAGKILLDSTDSPDSSIERGLRVTTQSEGRIQILLGDGKTRASWVSDKGLLRTNQEHHVVITVDGGPKIIAFVVDGVMCDGQTEREYGWGRFDKNLDDINAAGRLKIAQPTGGALTSLRVYPRRLRNYEAVDNFRSTEDRKR